MTLTPEQHARENIDRQLAAAGWLVQRYRDLNRHAGRGIAATEFPVITGPWRYCQELWNGPHDQAASFRSSSC